MKEKQQESLATVLGNLRSAGIRLKHSEKTIIASYINKQKKKIKSKANNSSYKN
jgi:hypothetical protein